MIYVTLFVTNSFHEDRILFEYRKQKTWGRAIFNFQFFGYYGFKKLFFKKQLPLLLK